MIKVAGRGFGGGEEITPNSEAFSATSGDGMTAECNRKPKLYVTRDEDGIFLWFGIDRPTFHGKRKRFQALANRIRLPVSWYDDVVDMGSIRAFDVEEVMRLA